MRKHYIRCLAVLSMIVGVFQFGVAESFAEASTATVTTEYALYDTMSPTEQKNLVTKQPEATINFAANKYTSGSAKYLQNTAENRGAEAK